MNLATTITLYAGGPGSGCNPEKGKCGRPRSSGGGDAAGKPHHLRDMIREMANIAGPRSLYKILDAHGHVGDTTPLTPAERREVRRIHHGRNCRVGFCYMNAQMFAQQNMNDRRVQYVEGQVTVYGVPIDHAWIEFNGKVYDPTLYNSRGKLKQKKRTDVPEYFGITIPKDDIVPHWLETKTYSPISQTRKFVDKSRGKS